MPATASKASVQARVTGDQDDKTGPYNGTDIVVMIQLKGLHVRASRVGPLDIAAEKSLDSLAGGCSP